MEAGMIRHHEKRLRPFRAVWGIDFQQFLTRGVDERGHNIDSALVDNEVDEVAAT
jgi:hypothetical protein